MPGAPALPRLFAPDRDAARRFIEFFTANIRNPHTRRAYARAAADFALWCDERDDIDELRDIEPVHVAAYVETLLQRLAPASVKQHLAAIKMLFDWLVVGQVIAANPASPVRGPKFSARKGKTTPLSAAEARKLLDSIAPTSHVALRDRALIALMIFTFARIGAALKMKVEDVFVKEGYRWVRLHEKGGKRHEMPCNRKLDAYLQAYIQGAGLAGNPKALLFPTAVQRNGPLSKRPMSQADAYKMVRRRATKAGIVTKVGNHTFRATGITEFRRKRGEEGIRGSLELAQQMANHASPRTTALYDHSDAEVSIEEVERIVI